MVKQRTKNSKINIANDATLANPNYLPGKVPPTHTPTSDQTKGTSLVGLKPFPIESSEAASKWYVDNFAAGSGGVSTIEDNGAPVASSTSILNFGVNLTVTDNGSGRVTIDSAVGTTPLTGKTFLPSTFNGIIFTKNSTSSTGLVPEVVDTDTVDLTVAGAVPSSAVFAQVRAQLRSVANGNNNISLMVSDTLANVATETNPKLTMNLVKETEESWLWGSVSDLTWVDDDYVTFTIPFNTSSDEFAYKIVDDRNDPLLTGTDQVTITFYLEGYWLNEIATVLPPPVNAEDLIGSTTTSLIIDGIEVPVSVNYLRVYNAATGQNPVIETFSASDANVNLEIKTKGTGLLIAETGYDMSLGPSTAFATKNYVDTAISGGSAYVKINSSGPAAVATGTDAIAIGENTVASATNAVVIGPSVYNTVANTVKIGSSNTNYLHLNAAADLTLYDGSGGSTTQIIVDGSAANISLQLMPKGTGVITCSSKRLTSVADPTSAQDAATKAYVDSILGGSDDYVKVNSTGTSASATGTNAIAIGEGASASATNTIAIGPAVTNSAANSVRIGTSATNYVNLSATGDLTFGSAGASIQVDNININGNSISSINSNGAIILDPNGTGSIDVSNAQIVNMANPTSAQHAATKAYVDTILPVGSIQMFAGSSAPPKWLICNGSAVSRTTYPALFGVVGITYGPGDGSTTFNLPNCSGRIGIGLGDSGTLGSSPITLAQTGGAVSTTLAVGNLPSHSHSITGVSTGSTTTIGSGTTTVQPGVAGGEDGGLSPVDVSNNTSIGHTHTISATIGSTGSNTPFTHMPPFIGFNFIIYAGV